MIKWEESFDGAAPFDIESRNVFFAQETGEGARNALVTGWLNKSVWKHVEHAWFPAEFKE